MGALLVGVVGAGILAVLLTAVERIDPEAGEPGPRRRGSRADLRWFGVYLAYAPLVAIGVMVLAARVSRHGLARAWMGSAPGPVVAVGAVSVAELVAYWLHRASHAVPALWRFHRMHHEPTELHWWSTFRFHPVDGALSHAVPLLVAAACGFGPGALSAYLAVVFVVVAFAHADVFVPGAFWEHVVSVPRFHRTHHEIGCDDTNFAVVLPVFDLLFGTAHRSAGTRRFGLAPAPVPAQRRTTNPIASEATLATQLSASAPSGSVARPRHTSSASR